MKVNKKIKIGICIVILLVILVVVFVIVVKPNYELNKATEYLKSGDYEQAYIYIKDKNNEKNIRTIKEFISLKLVDSMLGGCEQITTIANKGTEILNKINVRQIDYSLDDRLDIYVEKLEDYIKIKEKINKEMVIEDMKDTYDLYFEVIEFIHTNFKDMLNHIKDNEFYTNVKQMPVKLETLSVNTKSIKDNYIFLPKTKEIYNEIYN